MLVVRCVGRGDTGEIVLKWVFRRLRNSEGSGWEVVGDGVENTPGRWSVVPYTISAVFALSSSLRDVLIPRRMRGKVSIQASGLGWALRAALRWRWNLSTMPLD